MKKWMMMVLLVGLLALSAGCGKQDGIPEKEDVLSGNTTEQTTEKTTQEKQKASDGSTMDMTGVTKADTIDGFDQMAEPKEGETIATISVKDYGDITVKFFDKIAPYGVKNFVTHAKEGYYDGLTFHRVINDFMIQGGDPEGSGIGGESIWGEPFYNEISEQAMVLRGSLCYANSGVDPSNGSQFFITQMAKVTEKDMNNYEKNGYTFTDEQKKAYEQYGGAPWLQGSYTVFGQVIDGMDIVDQIAAVETDENDMPKEAVTISSIKVSEYKAK